ncbi:unnamed protein product, partial [Didymodactylos carnosus]
MQSFSCANGLPGSKYRFRYLIPFYNLIWIEIAQMTMKTVKCFILVPVIKPQKKTKKFSPPNKLWSPWRASSFTEYLETEGILTIEIEQGDEAIPFEILLSVNKSPKENTYSILLSVSERQVKISKILNNFKILLNQSTVDNSLLHLNDGQHKYWLSMDSDSLFVKYGQGEARDSMTMIKCDLNEEESYLLKDIRYVHIKLDDENPDLDKYEDKIRIKLGKDPVLNDPPLLIKSPVLSSGKMLQFRYRRTGEVENNQKDSLVITQLADICQTLYHDIMQWQLDNKEFSQFSQTIEESINNPQGWIYQKLEMKFKTSTYKNINETYLNIAIKSNITGSNVPLILEIWPPGHYSKIHAHSRSYGIMLNLYGEAIVELYSSLSVKHQKKFAQAILKQGDATWLAPGFNQIHKIINPSPHKPLIIIQAYQDQDENVINNYEYCDYISSNGKLKKNFVPKSDIIYDDFKQIMLHEWKNNHDQ